MKKRLFFLIALMCCFVLAACALSACNESGGVGQQTPDGGQPGTETPEQPGGEDPGDEPGEEVIQYRLVYAAASGGSIDGAMVQTVEEKGNGTAVTAVPDEGYEFVRWSDGRMDNPRTDSNVTSDVNVTAEFRLIGNTTDFAGGLIGRANGFTQITDSYVTEDLVGVTTGYGKVYVGGFIGYEHSELLVAHSYSTGIVDGCAIGGEYFVGGLVGYVGAGFTLQDTHWR